MVMDEVNITCVDGDYPYPIDEDGGAINNVQLGGGIEQHDAVSEGTSILGDSDMNDEPVVGMSFINLNDVKEFYGKYARRKGFGWRIRSSKRKEGGEVVYIILVCSRHGVHLSKISPLMKTLPCRPLNCDAKIIVKLEDDCKWYIKKVVIEHSHDLFPSNSRMFRVNKKLNLNVKRTIEVNDEAGVRICKTYRALAADAGCSANLEFTERDVRNYIHKERRAIGKDGDGQALKDYFSRMQAQNSNFFYDMDLDNEFRVKNIFWADARSRAAYESFGDVVTFDTTYLTNKYEMPFSAFVGVNHHGHSILLGCGLLSAEDTTSFVWLFSSWMHCMGGKAPEGIVTDQCKAMQNALKIVMPDTHHRWCLWHIMKKIPEKLKGYGQYKKIKDSMKSAVYDSLTVADFESSWNAFIEEFDLGGNVWLSGLYEERTCWVPIYLKKFFWAGMSTTQRSESIHAFFDGYVNASTSLQQFVRQYDNALQSKVEKEWEADFQSVDTIIQCASTSPIEKQFQMEYTHAKFYEAQIEFRGKMNCNVSLKHVDGAIATYEVLEGMLFGDLSKEVAYEVIFNREDVFINCQCMLFEFKGIMCRHSLCVLGQERVKRVPSMYVLRRWSKNIKRKHTFVKSSYDIMQLKPQMERFDKLSKHFNEVAEIAASYEVACAHLHKRIAEIKGEVMHLANNKGRGDEESPTQFNDNTLVKNIEVHSPLRVKRKGRPPSNRKISTLEKEIRKSKKKKDASKGGDEQIIVKVWLVLVHRANVVHVK